MLLHPVAPVNLGAAIILLWMCNENKNKKENIVNASNEALNEPIKEDVEEVNLEASKDSKEKKERNKKILKYIL